MMDEEDQEELRYTGSDVEIDEYTDTDELAYATATAAGRRATDDKQLFDVDQPGWQKFSFLATLTALVISVTITVITFPIYLESVGEVSNPYAGLLFVAFSAVCILGLVYLVVRRISPPPPLVPNSMRVKIPRSSLVKLGAVYALAGILMTLSLDRNHVLCHLQDPMKGITLVFSLVYYFFFCKKVMTLQRIFFSTTIIVGLFISVDYGLCDEFRCRGHQVSAHTVRLQGSWGTRAVWTFVYVGSLALFAMFFTLLERHFTTEQRNVRRLLTTRHDSFLYTVSRLVSSRDIRRRGSDGEEGGRLLHVTDPDPTIKPKNHPKPPVVETLLWVHACALLVILAFGWIDALPGIGRGLTPRQLYESLQHGLICHLGAAGEDCSSVANHGWILLLAYVLFVLSAVNFLSMCESAVFTVAATTVSLPLSGIWWSIYKMQVNGTDGRSILWSPEVTGELICALLGLPVVLLGLGFLVRAHFRDLPQAFCENVPPSTLQSPLQSPPPPPPPPPEASHRDARQR